MKEKDLDRKVIVISPPRELRDEKERVRQLMEAGLEYFHVRKPGFDRRDTEQYLRAYPMDIRKKMILHHHYDLVEPYDLRGIHIPERSKDLGYEAAHLNKHISISCHHTGELANLGRNYTYAFLSPVLNSLSKQDYPAAFKLNDLKKFFRESKNLPPVIALGGIHPKSIGQIQGTGFTGVALLGAIWPELSDQPETHCPLKNYLQIQELVQTL